MDLLTALALAGAVAGFLAGAYAALWNWITFDDFLRPMLQTKLAKRRAAKLRRQLNRQSRKLRP